MHVFSTLLKKLNVIHILIYVMISSVFIPVDTSSAYTLRSNLSCVNFRLIKATGKPGSGKNFKISLSAQCELIKVDIRNDKIFNRKNLQNLSVNIKGSYNYTTKIAKESIYYKDFKLYIASSKCSSNPWAHIPSCDGYNRGYTERASVIEFVNYKNDIDDPEYPADYHDSPISAHNLPGTTRNALSKWETSLSTKDLLAGWKPLPEKDTPELVILSPSGYTPTNGDSFKLDLIPVQTPLKGSVIEIEWALIGKPKDPSLSKEQWYENNPSQAPKTINWDNLPAQIKTKYGNYVIFPPGKYALRVKFKGLSESTWTDWKRFVIGQLTIKRFKKFPAIKSK